jgi:saccharopine dehydrogenase (NAD+, L-lysine-forming)
MANVLIIGAGGVGRVVLHKCIQNRELFSTITLASRRLSSCKKYQTEIKDRYDVDIDIAEVDADSVDELVSLIDKTKPDMVLNIALPYQDLTIMEACLQTKTNYLDTANYEHPDSAKFEYKEQWAYQDRYKDAGILALLGSGFDPGVTNVFCA